MRAGFLYTHRKALIFGAAVLLASVVYVLLVPLPGWFTGAERELIDPVLP